MSSQNYFKKIRFNTFNHLTYISTTRSSTIMLLKHIVNFKEYFDLWNQDLSKSV